MSIEINKSTKIWLLQAVIGDQEWKYLTPEGRTIALEYYEEVFPNGSNTKKD